ncbi:uncharacterized protein LOC117180295 isoform X2 [Belonocnema kinseyi]|uniref:uncharacterized protein LOC117180295 isoform X2 n=1 Tax=Belonocnema kinseyi TaxID=2817044 RepID=UPI00143D5A99|nr:uncharacterized protein LOC117180295 isoform X2 [Belonocnema kinseyi]
MEAYTVMETGNSEAIKSFSSYLSNSEDNSNSIVENPEQPSVQSGLKGNDEIDLFDDFPGDANNNFNINTNDLDENDVSDVYQVSEQLTFSKKRNRNPD